MIRSLVVVALLVAACDSEPKPPPPPSIEVIGHNDLLARGMNAAPAIIGNHMYIGSRTDSEFHDNSGVLIVDISDPTSPMVVGEIGEPDEALIGMTSRELRAVPDKNLLIVMNFSCSPDIHDCSRPLILFPETGGVAETDNFKFYDVSDPTSPQLITTYDFGSSPRNPEVSPHEFHLWRDPNDPDRVLLYVATPLGPPAMQVLDISDLNNIDVVATFDPEDDAGLEEPRGIAGALLHSVSVSADGRTGFISYETAGMMIINTSELADNIANPQIRMLTPVNKRIDYSPPFPDGTHSAVELPGRPFVILTDEVYPAPAFPGCPWGWARIVDYSNPQEPFIAGEYKVEENDPAGCTSPEGGPDFVTATAHNTTATENIALISWHSAGLEIVDVSDAVNPTRLLRFRPTSVGTVATEDPALGGDPVLMWSYPIIKDGLIYVVDVRNGLYILRYDGPYASEINDAAFIEGNSNLR